MARYFVHIDDGSAMPDQEGSEFSSLVEVESAVRQCLVEMMVDAALERRIFSIKIDVRNEAGELVMGGLVNYAINLTPFVAVESSKQKH